MSYFSALCTALQVPMTGTDRIVDDLADPLTSEENQLVIISSKDMARTMGEIRSKCWIIQSRVATPDLLDTLRAHDISYAVVNNIGKTMAQVIDHFHNVTSHSGIDPTAIVHQDALVDKAAWIGAMCFIGPGCSIGPGSVLHARVTLVQDVILGARVSIQSGSVVGSDGFGFYEDEGVYGTIQHVGKVIIGDDVWIGANCTIARGTLHETRIGRGSKIDNLVQIAHNVQIGDHTAIAAQVGVAGSTIIGSHVRIGGQAGLVGHIRIGDGATIGAQAGVIADVPPGQFVAGYPAEERIESLRKEVYIKRIPAILDEIKNLKKR